MVNPGDQKIDVVQQMQENLLHEKQFCCNSEEIGASSAKGSVCPHGPAASDRVHFVRQPSKTDTLFVALAQ